MTDVPNPQETQAPPAAGGVNPASTPDASTEGSPNTVSMTQDELNAKFGQRATEAKIALAKQYGYDDLSSFDKAMQDYRNRVEGEKTEAQKIQEENTNLKSQRTKAQNELQRIKLEREVEKQALALGADPTKLEAINALRKASSAELTEEGEPVADSIRMSVEAVFEQHPYFKAGGSGHRHIGQGSNPPPPGTKTDAQIQAELQQSGDFMGMIRHQMSRLAPKHGPIG